MPEYGLTPTGPHIKRLDEILDEMHTELSAAWGVNTRQDPQSLLNHLLTNVADQLHDLWVFAEEVYHSQYPTSAEGTSLDNSVQYGGIVREAAAKSYYRILCKGTDGTVIPAGAIIASNTNPPTQLTISKNAEITRGAFNKAEVVIAEAGTASVLSCMLNGTTYSYTPENGDSDEDKITGLAEAMASVEGYTVSCADGVLKIENDDEIANGVLLLSENLTTQSVSSIVLFATVEDGDILIPNGVITRIVKAVPGMEEVTNVGSYIAGREIETDTELRQSYVDKIYNRSSCMIESIRSAILERVPGVTTVSVYENDTNVTDAYGRPPHSVEVVADGSYDSAKLAQVILDSKAGGISTYGDHEIIVPGNYGEDITIRFNKPIPVYIWYEITVMFDDGLSHPSNYVDLVEEVVLEWMDKLNAGVSVVPQKFVKNLYDKVPGVLYFDIGIYATLDSGENQPVSYPLKSVAIDQRHKAVTDSGRIEVSLSS